MIAKSNLKLGKRAKAILLNDAIKIIQQASWDLKVISQQYPVSTMGETEYDEYISLVEDQVVNFSQAVAKLSLLIQR